MQYDVFICHASEDKKDFVRPLAEKLKQQYVDVWYDEFSLNIGDSLTQKIDEGLAKSRFGIVVLSHNFFNKPWAKREHPKINESAIFFQIPSSSSLPICGNRSFCLHRPLYLYVQSFRELSKGSVATPHNIRSVKNELYIHELYKKWN